MLDPRHGRVAVRTTRVRTITLAWTLVFGLLFLQMARLQVVNPEAAIAAGRRQRISETRIAPERGDILDRNGVPLAMSIRQWRVVADSMLIAKTHSEAVVAKSLGALLGVDATVIGPRLRTSAQTHYTIVVRGLDETLVRRLRAYQRDKKTKANLVGIFVEEEPAREHPAGDLAKSVIGSVERTTEKGVSGLELLLDDKLTGREGFLRREMARGKQIAGTEQTALPAERGTSFETTLDRSLQYSVEGMLATSMALNSAKGGMVIVGQPKTGDILAMANMAQNDGGEIVNTSQNCTLVCVYEPGSVNKAITIAAALEEGDVRAETRFDVPDHLQIYDHKFKDDEPHKVASWTPGEILANSSNIGTIMIAKRVGRDRLDRYLRAFGLGAKTGIEFPGESRGILPKTSQWTGTSIGNVPIGQGLAVTATQMLEVYNTLANDGVRVPMRLLRAVIGSDGQRRELPTGDRTTVVSRATARQVTLMLTEVVRSGTGRLAKVDGYTVAGKTGTAQKPGPNGGYSKDAYVASFAGYFPAEDPQLSVIVILDEPKTSIYGGTVAAPLFSEVARVAAAHYRLAPSPGIPMVSSSNLSDVGDTREANVTKKSGNWQQALIRRASLANQVVGATESVRSTAGTVRAIPTTSVAPPSGALGAVAPGGELGANASTGAPAVLDLHVGGAPVAPRAVAAPLVLQPGATGHAGVGQAATNSSNAAPAESSGAPTENSTSPASPRTRTRATAAASPSAAPAPDGLSASSVGTAPEVPQAQRATRSNQPTGALDLQSGRVTPGSRRSAAAIRETARVAASTKSRSRRSSAATAAATRTNTSSAGASNAVVVGTPVQTNANDEAAAPVSESVVAARPPTTSVES